jgi:hypothetical protein
VPGVLGPDWVEPAGVTTFGAGLTPAGRFGRVVIGIGLPIIAWVGSGAELSGGSCGGVADTLAGGAAGAGSGFLENIDLMADPMPLGDKARRLNAAAAGSKRSTCVKSRQRRVRISIPLIKSMSIFTVSVDSSGTYKPNH